MRDFQRSKVYTAENKVFNKRLPAEYDSMQQCKEFATTIVSSEYWESCKGLKRFKLGDGRGRRNAGAKSKGIHAKKDIVLLPKWSRSKWLIIHEFSHILTNQTDKGTVPHGAVFCTHYLALVRELLGNEIMMDLQNSFDNHGVKYLKQLLAV